MDKPLDDSKASGPKYGEKNVAALIAFAAWLDRKSSHPRVRRFSRKIFRLALPRPFKHLTHAGARFTMRNPAERGTGKIICWDGKAVAQTQPLSSIRNTENGTCFILATGPSIKEQNLELLRGRKVIGVNGAISKMQELQIVPTHYVITDDDFAVHRFEMLRQAVDSGAKCFFAPSVLAVMCEQEPQMLQRKNIFLIEPINQLFGIPRLAGESFLEWVRSHPDVVLPTPPHEQVDRIGFSLNVEDGIFTACTVVYGALQIAYYLGFRRICILGMDLDYSGPNPRFYESSAQMRPSQVAHQYEPVIKPSFELVRELCDREKLQVYNLSPKSRLPAEIIPRLTLEDAVSGS